MERANLTGAGMRKAGFGVSLLVAAACLSHPAAADEGGVGWWLPGFNGSLVAVPSTPGWSWTSAYYHVQPSASGAANFSSGAQVRAGLEAVGDLALFGPTYTFPEPVLGGQAAFTILAVAGHMKGSIDAVLTGPNGLPIAGTSRTDTTTAFGDLFFQGTLKWNQGVHNYMTYWMASAPVGSYDPNRLANVGLGHAGVDGGVGYTYFNPTTGHEFSVLAGLTYNFENPDTNYQNGVTAHVDWAASQFLSKQTFIGVGGYLYNQIGCDSGSGATLGCFRSRVAGVGPQIGYIFPVNEKTQGALVLKGFWEFAAQHRPEGWNAILALQMTPAAQRK